MGVLVFVCLCVICCALIEVVVFSVFPLKCLCDSDTLRPLLLPLLVPPALEVRGQINQVAGLNPVLPELYRHCWRDSGESRCVNNLNNDGRQVSTSSHSTNRKLKYPRCKRSSVISGAVCVCVCVCVCVVFAVCLCLCLLCDDIMSHAA